MKPIEKSKGIENFLKNLMGFDRRDFIKKDICTLCKKPATNFKDEISRKEFSISGFCQECQNKAFN